jgi:hypothetical protein
MSVHRRAFSGDRGVQTSPQPDHGEIKMDLELNGNLSLFRIEIRQLDLATFSGQSPTQRSATFIDRHAMASLKI